jgi:hypothetical protein|tara:strand:- start:597 stop:980 length:384 start_codon:yes stop_codon:yes gene_type:complete
MSEIILRIGDTSILDVSIYKDELLLDLTEYLVLFTIKKPFTGYIGLNPTQDTEAVIVKNSEPDGGIEKYATGKTRISLSSADTKALPDGQYDYDIQISKPDTVDTVITVDSGNISFSKEVTNRIAPT